MAKVKSNTIDSLIFESLYDKDEIEKMLKQHIKAKGKKKVGKRELILSF